MINPGRTFILLCLGLGLLLSPFMLLAQQQRIELQLSANRVSADESVILNVQAFGMDSDIDYSALNKDFDVTKRSSSRKITIENGKQTNLVEWVLELAPKKTGALEIPPISVGPEQSRSITLLVENAPTGVNRDLYLEATVDDPKPYVQAQSIYTLRVFVDVRLVDASLQVPEIEGAVLQQLSEGDSYQEVIDGRTYLVREFRYAIFPQSSGTVVVPPMALQAVVAVNRAQAPNTSPRTRRITRRSNEIQLSVQARPDDSTGSWWLPAKQVKLNSEWSESVDNLMVDQPITRTVHLMATGVGDTQLPEISVPELPNISIYADSPEVSTSANEKGLVSQQTNTWAVIPQTIGQLIMPEVRVNWFDTTTGQARVAILPEEILNVTGSAASAVTPATQVPPAVTQATDIAANTPDTDAVVELPSTDANSVIDNAAESGNEEAESLANVVNAIDDSVLAQQLNRWRTAAYALAAAWALSLGSLWLWFRKRLAKTGDQTPRVQTETRSMRFQRRAGSKASLEPIRAACDSGDASTISKALLAWGAMVWPESVPTNTSQIAKRLQSASLSDSFSDLDAQQFNPDAGVNSVAVSAIPDQLKQAVDQYQASEPQATGLEALPTL